ncbi:MAG TPA: CD225/dispanin family protein, partial [Streptosporangiaceae bacterium]|nr:CD225/dispanin family protein [Streptosporangiaceae bacterium]
RETLPPLDLNLTGHAENPRGWTATRIETASAKAWTGPACTYRTSGSARVAAATLERSHRPLGGSGWYGRKVTELWARGDVPGAISASRKARAWLIASIVLDVIGLVLSVVLVA